MLHNFGMNFAELDFAFKDFLVLKFVKFGFVRLCFFFLKRKPVKVEKKWERSEERERKSNLIYFL